MSGSASEGAGVSRGLDRECRSTGELSLSALTIAGGPDDVEGGLVEDRNMLVSASVDGGHVGGLVEEGNARAMPGGEVGWELL